MAAVIIEIADAVAAALDGGFPYAGFTAERAYVPILELDELDDLRVTVVPRELTMTALSRRDDDFDYIVDVAIVQRKPDTANATVDPLMLMVEQVMDLFRGQRLTGYESARCVAAANAPIFVPDFLDEKKVFLSVVSLTFRVARAR